MAAKPEIKRGQVWRTRGGLDARVVHHDHKTTSGYVWDCVYISKYRADNEKDKYDFSVDKHGFEVDSTTASKHDLIRLIEDPPMAVEFARPDEHIDVNDLAAETLSALGWWYNGKCWVQDNPDTKATAPQSHPLYPVFIAAIEQAMYGKGERHGGATTPFLEQPWAHYAKLHGRGFLTGQAAKKLEEAANTRQGEAFEAEVFGAMVYLGMSVLKERGVV